MATKATLLLAIACVSIAVQPAEAQRTSKLPAGCSKVTMLQDSFRLLNEQIELDRQVIANFGFDRTVADFERAAALPQAQVGEGIEGIKKLLFEESMRTARAEIIKQLQSGSAALVQTAGREIVTGAAGRLAASAKGNISPEALEVIKRLGIGNPDLVRKATLDKDLEAALEILDRATLSYSVGSDLAKRQLLEAGLTLVEELVVEKLTTYATPAGAGWVGLMLSVDKWAWMLAYESADAVMTVRRLTKSTTGELKLLTNRADANRKRVLQLVSVRARLQDLGRQCDSSKLAKKRGGFGTVTAVLIGASTAAAAGAYLYSQELEEGGSSGSCISTRTCIINFISATCSCAGTPYGRCDYSGTPGDAGDYCGGGNPCREGLSCNNGRCEGSGGRCSF